MFSEMAGILDIFTTSIHDKIADVVIWKYPKETRTRADIAALSAGILPVYQAAVRSGLPLFVDTQDRAIQVKTETTFRKVAEQTGADQVFLYRYLASVEHAAKAGWIPFTTYNPVTAVIAAKETKAAEGTKGSWLDPIVAGLSGQVTKIALIGAAGLVGYGILRTIILKPRPATA